MLLTRLFLDLFLDLLSLSFCYFLLFWQLNFEAQWAILHHHIFYPFDEGN